MSYDIVGLNGKYYEKINFFTIQDLINLGNKYPDKVFRLLETDYCPDKLISWRGSYILPAIKYSSNKKTGKEIAEGISSDLNKVHYGYKGGEYEYAPDDEFYLVSDSSSADEYKICGYELQGDEVVLLTKIDKY